MAKPVMKYGARKGKMSTLRRWIAKASARDIRVFPVPGTDILQKYQNISKSDCIIATNPREANVLLIMGELTDVLAQKAAVTYQQIPRPRVLVVAGPQKLPHLPKPNVHLSLKEDFLDNTLPEIRELLQHHAWSGEAEPWEPEFLKDLVEDSDSIGHNHHHHDHGDGDGENGNEHSHDDGEHESHEDTDDHEQKTHQNEGDHNHGEHDHEDHGNGHDHGDMDFMSMVAMTKDLPRPKDGLPMDRSKAHFGPFHPGLPGGLSVIMELDGDTVIKARVEDGLTARSFEEVLPLKVSKLPNVLGGLNPLTPETYQLLAQKALENALKDGQKSFITSDDLLLLETERIGSHLNWLATFAKMLGSEWIHQESARWHALHRSNEYLPENLLAFLERIRSMPYLQTKLSIGGIIPWNLMHHLSGPVAKAAGKTLDARSGSERYQSIGWKPVTRTENSAWGRLLVRLEEIEQSLELIEKVKERQAGRKAFDFSGSGKGAAQLESPRGIVSLEISVMDGVVEQLQIAAPSKPLAALVPTLTQETELSDMLVQIASLDISPWEVRLKSSEVQ